MVRPYSSSEVVDTGLRIFRRMARACLPITLGPMAVCSAAILFVWTFGIPALFNTTKGADVTQQMGEVAAALLGLFFLAIPLWIIGFAAATAPVIRLASQVILGEKLDVRKAEADLGPVTKAVAWVTFGVVARSFWLPLGTLAILAISSVIYASYPGEEVQAVAGVVAFIGGGLSIVVAPTLLKMVALAPVVSVLENRSPKDALKRAQSLAAKHHNDSVVGGTVMTYLFTYLFLYFAVSYGVTLILQGIGVPSWAGDLVQGAWRPLTVGLVEALPFMATLWLLAPSWATVMTVLYYDRRVRHEGLDIEILAKDVLHADRQAALLN